MGVDGLEGGIVTDICSDRNVASIAKNSAVRLEPFANSQDDISTSIVFIVTYSRSNFIEIRQMLACHNKFTIVPSF